MSPETIAVLANIALTLSLVVAIIFGLAQIKAAKRDRRERLTLETLRAFHSREFSELILFSVAGKTPRDYKEWIARPAEDKARFIQLTQQMESLGILLADGFIDFDLVDKTLGSYVSTTWARFKPLILNMRTDLPDPFMSEYFQWMAEQIEKRMTERPRQPFYLQKSHRVRS
jgi:hypothetical protein